MTIAVLHNEFLQHQPPPTMSSQLVAKNRSQSHSLRVTLFIGRRVPFRPQCLIAGCGQARVGRTAQGLVGLLVRATALRLERNGYRVARGAQFAQFVLTHFHISITPSNTVTAGPVINTGVPSPAQLIDKSPPRVVTRTG